MSDRAYRIVLTIFLIMGILALAWILRDVARRLHEDKPIVIPVDHPPAPLNLTENETARANANPVVPGGIKNVAALRAVIQRDDLIAAHYKSAGFNINCAMDEILAANAWANVSYRWGNTFLYTKGLVLLLAGEHLIVDNCDGVIIRGKCANVVLLAAKYPEAFPDVPIGELIPPVDIPPSDFVPPITPSALPATPTPPIPPGGLPPIDWYPPFPCCAVPFPPGGPPPVSTDEGGSTFWYVATAILVLIARGKRKTDAN
jgi:hypothetical protein